MLLHGVDVHAGVFESDPGDGEHTSSVSGLASQLSHCNITHKFCLTRKLVMGEMRDVIT